MANGRTNVGGGGVKILDTIIQEYQIEAGQNLVTGDLVEFINNKAQKSLKKLIRNTSFAFYNYSITDISACKINDTNVLVVYAYSTTAYAVVLTVSGTTVTKGTVLTVSHNGYVYYKLPLVKVDENKFLTCYWMGSPYTTTYVVVLTVSGTTVTKGSYVNLGYCRPESLSLLETNKVFFAGRTLTDSMYYGVARILTVSGTTISVTTETIISNAYTNKVISSKVATDRVIVVYSNYNDYTTKTRIISISGTSMVPNTELLLNTLSIYYDYDIIMTLVENNKVLIGYSVSSTYYATTVILSVNDVTITVGTPVTIIADHCVSYNCILYSANVAASLFGCQTGSKYKELSFLSISGTTITKNSEKLTIQGDFFTYAVFNLLTTDKLLLAYNALANSGYGTAEVINKMKTPNGIAKQNGVGGETKKFLTW